MTGLRQISMVAALLALAGCATKKTVAPVVPAAPVAPAATSRPATPKPRVPAPAAQTPASPVVGAPASPVVGAPAPAPPARPPMTLESRTDPLVDRPSVEARIHGVQGLLVQLNSRSLTGSLKDDRDRVAAMLDSARKSLASGDIRQANELSARAETLARALLNAR